MINPPLTFTQWLSSGRVVLPTPEHEAIECYEDAIAIFEYESYLGEWNWMVLLPSGKFATMMGNSDEHSSSMHEVQLALFNYSN